MTSKVVYTGGLHTVATHLRSGSKIETDAPKDNHGKGERFSPTDLIGASLGSCILTTMAILTEKEDLDLKGAHCTVSKEMTSNPRRIAQLKLEIHLPAKLSAEQ